MRSTPTRKSGASLCFCSRVNANVSDMMRTTLLLLCTGLSFMGFIYPIMLIATLLGAASSPIPSYKLEEPSFLPFVLLGSISLYAWLCYFVMGIAWVKNVQVKKWWPLTGTLAGFATLSPGFLNEAPFQEALIAFVAPLLYVLPAFLLASWLVIFHLKQGVRFNVGRQDTEHQCRG